MHSCTTQNNIQKANFTKFFKNTIIHVQPAFKYFKKRQQLQKRLIPGESDVEDDSFEKIYIKPKNQQKILISHFFYVFNRKLI